MIIGVLKEIKIKEFRVAKVHCVLAETQTGLGFGVLSCAMIAEGMG
jgi:hypothetical protein